MIVRPTRWAGPTLLLFVAGAALAITTLSIQSGPTATAKVGVPYSSGMIATGGTGFYSYYISSGSLPDGLLLNANTGAIAGTPTVAGVFTFVGAVSDAVSDAPVSPPSGPDSQAVARRRTLAQSGNHGATASSSFTITVAGVTQTVAGAPTSPWTLALIIAALAAFGFFRLRLARG